MTPIRKNTGSSLKKYENICLVDYFKLFKFLLEFKYNKYEVCDINPDDQVKHSAEFYTSGRKSSDNARNLQMWIWS